MNPCQSFEAAANAAIAPYQVCVKTPDYPSDRIRFRVVAPHGRPISKTYWVTPHQVALQLERLVTTLQQRMRATGYGV